MDNEFDRVLRLCTGKTVREVGYVSEHEVRLGVRITFTDDTVVQFLYDRDDADFLAQEVE